MDVLIIDGHPDADSLTAALAQSYAHGATRSRLLPLRELSFDPILRRSGQALEPDLIDARAAITAARHVAWFFPNWWGGAPALLKGFIDRTFSGGYAYRYVEGNPLPKRLLVGRNARVVTTMDSPGWWYTTMYQRSLHAAFLNATLRFVGFSVQTTTLYAVRTQSADALRAKVARMQTIGARDAQSAARLAARHAPLLPASTR